MESWINDAKRVSSLESEVCFLLQNSFYFGPDKHPEVAERKLAAPLILPDIPRKVASMVRSSEAIGHERPLAAYYEQIVRLAQRHQKPFEHIRHYFWLRFSLWNSDENVHISFPWYDTFSEIDRLLASISSVESGEVYYDVDQGWELNIQAKDGVLLIRERDPDYEETNYVVSVDRADLLPQLASLRSHVTTTIAVLANLLGADVWTSRIVSPLFTISEPPAAPAKRPWWRLW